eukprot:scaffold7621_cov70-Phaeocystis_antarctica.AAC.3
MELGTPGSVPHSCVPLAVVCRPDVGLGFGCVFLPNCLSVRLVACLTPHACTSAAKAAKGTESGLQEEMLVTTILVLVALGGVAARCQYTPDANGHVAVPDGVTSLGNQAFDQCKSLVSVTLPESLMSIGYYTFQYCSSLTSVSLPDSLTELGGGAFHGATSLAS